MTIPPPTALQALSASAAAQAIAAGELTATALVTDLLARIEAREPTVKAWVWLDRDAALAAAAARDSEPPMGPLHGVPIGIKDVIDTADMPTEYGSPIHAGHHPAKDATCVARLKRAGSIILGKTATTEFAFAHPTATTNPHNPAHTPGGSSSGSAAAVADFHVSVTLATQTGGSTIRPAAYCGVIGVKPAYGRIDYAGLKFLAPLFDTIGLMGRSLADVALVSAVLTDAPPALIRDAGEPRFVLSRTPGWDDATAPGRTLVEDTAAQLAQAGAAFRVLALPPPFDRLDAAHRVVMADETAQSLAPEWRDHADQLSAPLRAFIERGRTASADEVAAAWSVVTDCRGALAELFAPDEVIVTLSTPGEAPAGLATTGDARFNRLWTLLHVPCLHLPIGVGPGGLPLGVQLVAPRSDDAMLLAAAAWAARALDLPIME